MHYLLFCYYICKIRFLQKIMKGIWIMNKESGTHDTFKEIKQQPHVWKKVFGLIREQKREIDEFIRPLLSTTESEVIFTGAGSSFFAGEMIAGVWQYHTGMSSKAVSSTEIVTHPVLYLSPDRPLLVVSFARSGNSPESIAAINMIDNMVENVRHLIITCNKKGELASYKGDKPNYILVLPEETNDKGLAMTSSVSSMYLSALLISRLQELDTMRSEVEKAARYASGVISEKELLSHVAGKPFERAVFLGSGMFLGLAREAHLKLQELTNGTIICKFDSFLGFRHGPKAVVNNKTLVCYLFSNNKYVAEYEQDLACSFSDENRPMITFGISEFEKKGIPLDSRLYYNTKETGEPLYEPFLLLPHLVAVQLLAYYKSLLEGYNPDSPSVNGAISRVVKGVRIYSYDLINEAKAKL